MSQDHVRGEECMAQSSSRSSFTSYTTISPRVTSSRVYSVFEHNGAHRDGYSDDKCRDVLVRFCSAIPRNYNYADGLQLVYEILREYLGDENLDLASGVFYEMVEVPSQYTSDEGASFRRWKYDHCRRNGDLENGHVPRLGNVVISQVVPTVRLRNWREGHNILSLSGRSTMTNEEATKGDSMKRYGIKGRSEWQINHTLYVSSRREGTKVIYCPNPKEFHELSWNYGLGSGGTLLGKKIILEEDCSPPKVSTERVLGFAIVQPLPKTLCAVISGTVKKIAKTFRHKMSYFALLIVQKKEENDNPPDNINLSVLEYESQVLCRNLPDVDSFQGRIQYGQIPNYPVPEGVMVSGQFARKFGLLTSGENLADLKIVKSMPTAEDLAIARGLETYANDGLGREASRWHSAGPETAQLFKDDGSMAYEWLRPQSDLWLFGRHCRPSLRNFQPPGAYDGADDCEEPDFPRTKTERSNGNQHVSCGVENEVDEESQRYKEAFSGTHPNRQLMRQETVSSSVSKMGGSVIIHQRSPQLDILTNRPNTGGSKTLKGPPSFLKFVRELKNAVASGHGRSTFNKSDNATTMCNTLSWALPESCPLSVDGIHEVSNNNTTLERASHSILPNPALSAGEKYSLEDDTALKSIKYYPSIKQLHPQPPIKRMEESETRETLLFQTMLKKVRSIRTARYVAKISRMEQNRVENQTQNPQHVHHETLDILEGRAGHTVPHAKLLESVLFRVSKVRTIRSGGQPRNRKSPDRVVHGKSKSSMTSMPLMKRRGSRGLPHDVPDDESVDASSQIEAQAESFRGQCTGFPLKDQLEFLWCSPARTLGGLERVIEEGSPHRPGDPFVDSKSTLQPDQQNYKLDTPNYLPKFPTCFYQNHNQPSKSLSPAATHDQNESALQLARASPQRAAGAKIKNNAINTLKRESQSNNLLNISGSETLLSDSHIRERSVLISALQQPLDYTQKLSPLQLSRRTNIQSLKLQYYRHDRLVAAMSFPGKTKFLSGILGDFVPLDAPDESNSTSSAVREIKKVDNLYEEIAKSNPYETHAKSVPRASHEGVSCTAEFGNVVQSAKIKRSNSTIFAKSPQKLHEMQSAEQLVSADTVLPRQSSIPDTIYLHHDSDDKSAEPFYSQGPLKSTSIDQAPHSQFRSEPHSLSLEKKLPDVPEADETSVRSTPAAELIRSPLPGKKLFGEGGWLGMSMDPSKVSAEQYAKPKSDKPSMVAQMKTAMQEIGRKADFSPVKMIHNALRKEKKDDTPVRSPISLTPAEQAQVYVDLELLICAVANRFLVHEVQAGRLTAESTQKISEEWRKKGRDRVIEFQYDQSTQQNLILLDLHVLRFYGVAACNPVQITAVLHGWKVAAREMSVRTFCSPDTVIDKHLSFAYTLLGLLGAEAVFFMALQEIRGIFNNKVRKVLEELQLQRTQYDDQIPSESSLHTAGNATVDTSNPLRRSQSFRQSILSSISRHSRGSSQTNH